MTATTARPQPPTSAAANSELNSGAGPWRGLLLEPLDVLFFRDGRPFADNVRNTGGLPTPQTLAGALRTALLEEAGLLGEFRRRWRQTDQLPYEVHPGITRAEFRGPWLARIPDPSKLQVSAGKLQVLVPMPANVFRDGQVMLRADPAAQVPTAWTDRATPRPLMLSSAVAKAHPDAKAASGFVTLDGLQHWLAGGVPQHSDVVSASELFDFDNRTGIVIDPDRLTTVEGQIYSAQMLALRPGVAMYAEVSQTAPVVRGPIAFGGEGRHVRVRAVAPIPWPVVPPTAGRQSWYLASPALLGGALPSELDGLVAAAVGNPLAVSGWDTNRNAPRPTRYAAPAGSVYFTQTHHPALTAKMQHWGTIHQEGWGLALPGTWEESDNS